MDYTQIIDFWFEGKDNPQSNEALMRLWFEGSDDTDRIIQTRFQSYVSMAGEGKLTLWLDEPLGTLACILLLDQFSRNIYRGLAAAFRYDEFALALCKKGLASGQDQLIEPIYRIFFYMPLQHSENIEDQEESLFRFDQLCSQAKDQDIGFYENFYQYAHIHFDIIKKFGRFPYRNAVLGRLNTQEESQWLASDVPRFGQ